MSMFAMYKEYQKPSKDVSTELLTALKIRQEQKDILGECGSYNYLTNYYLDKKPDSALIYAQKMYEKVKVRIEQAKADHDTLMKKQVSEPKNSIVKDSLKPRRRPTMVKD